MSPDRVHIVAPANPLFPDAQKLGFHDVAEYVGFVRQHLPRDLRLSWSRPVLRAREDEWHGGRQDDHARIRDLQNALDDPATLAIVATNGGAYLSRILPHLDFSALARRREPLWVFGFSELTGLVNLVARQRGGRGVYWLCPNFLGWHLRPEPVARAAFAEFWQLLPQVCAGRWPGEAKHLCFEPIRGELRAGKLRAGSVRLVGGCLAVLAALVGGKLGRRLRPDGHWLFLEDIKEAPYRIDRHLAALKVAGWFERIAGLLIGDFRMMHTDTQPAVLELLRYHLAGGRNIPIVTTRSIGHVWPHVPVIVNQPLRLAIRGRQVEIGPPR